MSGALAEATICDTGGCYSNHLIVRGTHVSFVSVEQVHRSGARRYVRDGDVYWEPRMPRADVTFPRGFVLVHDATGTLLDRCDFYIVKYRRGGHKNAPDDVLDEAEKYFKDSHGNPIPLSYGSVEIPEGPWAHLARVRLVRYSRPGFKKPFEHEYDPPVDVRYSRRVLGYRLPLPSGCVVDAHGFRWP